MSGGHFEYKQMHIRDISEEIDRTLEDESCSFEPETRVILQQVSDDLMKLYYKVKAIDYMLSSDTSEDDMLEYFNGKEKPC